MPNVGPLADLVGSFLNNLFTRLSYSGPVWFMRFLRIDVMISSHRVFFLGTFNSGAASP